MEMFLIVLLILVVLLIGLMMVKRLDIVMKDRIRRSLSKVSRGSRHVRIGLENDMLKKSVEDAAEFCQVREEILRTTYHGGTRERLLKKLHSGWLEMVILESKPTEQERESLMVLELDGGAYLLWNAYHNDAARDRFLFVLKNHFALSKRAYRSSDPKEIEKLCR